MPPDDPPPPELRFIKRLVVVLTSVMIVGVLVIIGLIVTRLGMAPAPLALPDRISLPAGTQVEALTLSQDWVIVLTRDDTALLFNRRTGELRHQITLEAD